MSKEILTVIINLTQQEQENILEKMSMDFGTTKTKYFTHEVSKDSKVSHVPAFCQKMLNEIYNLSDIYGVEFYQGLKVIISHQDLVTLCYLVKELKLNSIRVFDKNLREFI